MKTVKEKKKRAVKAVTEVGVRRRLQILYFDSHSDVGLSDLESLVL